MSYIVNSRKIIVFSGIAMNGKLSGVACNNSSKSDARDLQQEGPHKGLTRESLNVWVKHSTTREQAFLRSDFEAYASLLQASKLPTSTLSGSIFASKSSGAGAGIVLSVQKYMNNRQTSVELLCSCFSSLTRPYPHLI